MSWFLKIFVISSFGMNGYTFDIMILLSLLIRGLTLTVVFLMIRVGYLFVIKSALVLEFRNTHILLLDILDIKVIALGGTISVSLLI